MDWITDKVAIGCYLDAQDADLLRRESIRSVLGLVATLDGKSPTELGLARIEIITLVDGPGNDPSRFARAVDMLTELAAESAPVLVHCRAGWSRSPAVVAGLPDSDADADGGKSLGRSCFQTRLPCGTGTERPGRRIQ